MIKYKQIATEYNYSNTTKIDQTFSLHNKSDEYTLNLLNTTFKNDNIEATECNIPSLDYKNKFLKLLDKYNKLKDTISHEKTNLYNA